MEEGDELAAGPGTGFPVDQFVAGLEEFGERRTDVRDAVAQVMHPRSAAFQEPRDGRVGTGGRDQLDSTGAGPDEDQIDRLRLDPFARGTDSARQGFPEGKGIVDRLDGDPDMIQSPWSHTRQSGGDRFGLSGV